MATSVKIPRGFVLIKSPHEKLLAGLLEKARLAGMSFAAWASQQLEAVEANDRLRKLPPPPEIFFADDTVNDDDERPPRKKTTVQVIRRRSRPLTKEEQLRIIAAHRNGTPVPAIAESFKRGPATVYRTLWKHGIEAHQPNRRSNK